MLLSSWTTSNCWRYTHACACLEATPLFRCYPAMHLSWDAGAPPSSCVSCWQLIGRGRYGTVYRGLLGERCVAVKLFSSANRQTFTNECCIYSLPLLQQHLNVARFLSAEQRTIANGRPEFLIVMDFYPEVKAPDVGLRNWTLWSKPGGSKLSLLKANLDSMNPRGVDCAFELLSREGRGGAYFSQRR